MIARAFFTARRPAAERAAQVQAERVPHGAARSGDHFDPAGLEHADRPGADIPRQDYLHAVSEDELGNLLRHVVIAVRVFHNLDPCDLTVAKVDEHEVRAPSEMLIDNAFQSVPIPCRNHDPLDCLFHFAPSRITQGDYRQIVYNQIVTQSVPDSKSAAIAGRVTVWSRTFAEAAFRPHYDRQIVPNGAARIIGPYESCSRVRVALLDTGLAGRAGSPMGEVEGVVGALTRCVGLFKCPWANSQIRPYWPAIVVEVVTRHFGHFGCQPRANTQVHPAGQSSWEVLCLLTERQ